MDFMTYPKYQTQQITQVLIKRNYAEIYAHEAAHKRAGGSLAGPIVIEKNNDGVPVMGHVSIEMPVLDENNPDKTINHADIVIESALAPSSPSEQDYKVAKEAKLIKSEAERVKYQKYIDYYA